jgi:hypothetical protein
MKITGYKRESVEVEISESDLVDHFIKLLLDKAKLPSRSNSWLHVNADNIIMEEREIGAGSHSYYEDTKLDTTPFKLKVLNLVDGIKDVFSNPE